MSFVDGSDDAEDEDDDLIVWRDIDVDEDDTEELKLEVKIRKNADEDDNLKIRVRAGSDCGDETSTIHLGGSTTTPTPNGEFRILKQVDRVDAGPGDEVTYTVTITNNTNKALTNFTVSDSFNQSQITMGDTAGGFLSGSRIEWNVSSLGMNQSRTFVYRGRLSTSLRHGDIVSNTVIAQGGNLGTPRTASVQVYIIQQLPQTGITDFTGPLATAAGQIRAINAASGGTLPGMLGTMVSLSAMAGGALLGRKFWF
jgi:uncharacterized repeat protein (TIGR01451 family)